jgi:hypothetical protein
MELKFLMWEMIKYTIIFNSDPLKHNYR